MPDIDFNVAAGVSGLVGLLVYVAFPPIDKTLEAVGFGGLIPIGLHLIVGAFDAEMLCHATGENGKVIEGLHLTFAAHTWEVMAGGIGLVFASIHSLRWLCLRPSHQHHP